jgi:hypothetical protein
MISRHPALFGRSALLWNELACLRGKAIGDKSQAANSGNVTDAAWKASQLAAWSDEQSRRRVCLCGSTLFTAYFLNYAQTELDV